MPVMYDLKPIKSGDKWNGITFPQILRSASEEEVGTPVDLTGAIATFQVKANPKDAVPALDLRSDGESPRVLITGPIGPIVVLGQVVDLEPRLWFWELELWLPEYSGPKTWAWGRWQVTQDVARREYV